MTTTKRIWRRDIEEKRGRSRMATDFYAVAVADGGRYLRRVANVSGDGLLLENALGDEVPGQAVELELPRQHGETPIRVQGEVVYVTDDGRVGVRVTSAALPVGRLGGDLAL